MLREPVPTTRSADRLLDRPLRTVELLCVDTETNGLGGERCELTEVGAVLVGGGELHERFGSLVRPRGPLSRGIQRFTGITQAMADDAPEADAVLRRLVALLEGPEGPRVLVAHNASFDRRVLRQACARAGVAWPDPPSLCTVALARRLAPLAGRRELGALAESLGIDVGERHRALADAETCARVLCALFPRLCAHAGTVGEALAVLRAAKPSRRRAPRAGATDGGRRGARRRPATPCPPLDALPRGPGVYLFRNAQGQVLYVGKSVEVRKRARAHFAASSEPAPWTAQAVVADAVATGSELGALVTEARLVREHLPPGNARLKHRDPLVFLRCRFDLPFPVLEVAPDPAAGHGVTIGPLRGRASAVELKEQLDSLFGLRHCGRALKRRDHPSAYGEMGRCLSPCLGDLDPNLYRRRLDAALGLFCGGADGSAALLAHLDAQMRAAADEQAFERAAWLRRRRRRLAELLDRLGGVLRATHAGPRLVRAPHPEGAGGGDLAWLVGGRVVDLCRVEEAGDVVERTAAAMRHQAGTGIGSTAHVPSEEVAEVRAATAWLAANRPPALALEPRPAPDALRAFAATA